MIITYFHVIFILILEHIFNLTYFILFLSKIDSEEAATRFISKEQNVNVSDVIAYTTSMASACPLGLYYPAVSACIEAGGGCDLEGKSSRILGRLNMSHLHIQSTANTTAPSTSTSSSQRVGSSSDRPTSAPRRGKTVAQGYDASHPPPVEEQQQILKSLSMHAGKAVFPLPSGRYIYMYEFE